MQKRFKSYLFIILAIVSISNLCCSERQKEEADFKIGVALYSFNRFSFQEAVEKASLAEVKFVEGFSFHALGEEFGGKKIIDITDQEASLVGQILENRKVFMPSIYADGKTMAEWEKLFYQAEKLGLDFLVGEPEPQFLDDVNRLAGEHHMQFAIHEHAVGLSRYWHPDSAMAAIEGRENLKVCADIGHWVRSGLDPVECLRVLEGNILSVHVKDLDSFGNINALDVNIGTGIIDYQKILEELKRQRFTGYVFVECEHNWEDNFSDVQESVRHIKDLAK